MRKHLRKIKGLIGVVIMLAMIITSVSFPAEVRAEDKSDLAEWSIYIYFCGADLETKWGAATGNINSILNVPHNDKVNYVMQVGGSKDWKLKCNDIDTTRTQRYVAGDGKLDLVYDEPLTNMTTPEAMTDFINWGFDNYPAKKTMFVFWDHGGAVLGGCWNELYSDDHLSIEDMVKGFEDAGKHFDIIGFDQCLMADFDIMNAMSPFADYMIASEEVEPGDGWGYDGFCNELFDNPYMSPKTLGKSIVNNYVDYLTIKQGAGTYTMSLIDLKKIDNLKSAVENMVDALIASMDDTEKLSVILRTAFSSKQYYYEFQKDLVSLSKDLAPYIGQDVCDAVCDAVDDVVVARSQFDETEFNNGVAFYWGVLGPDVFNQYYERFACIDKYLAFIDACRLDYSQDDSVYENTDLLPDISYDDFYLHIKENDTDDVFKELEVDGGERGLVSVRYSLYSQNESGQIFKIAELGNLKMDESNTKFVPAFDGKIMYIDGIPAVFNVYRESEEYIIYNVPVFWVFDDEMAEKEGTRGTSVDLRVLFTPDKVSDSESDFVGDFGGLDEGQYEIIGMANSNGNSYSDPVARDIDTLEEGMEFCVLYSELDDFDGVIASYLGDSFVYSKSTVVAPDTLKDGDYFYSYSVMDYSGKEKKTPVDKISVVDGRAVKCDDDNDSEEAADDSEKHSYKEKFNQTKEDRFKGFADYGTGEYHIEKINKTGDSDASSESKVTVMIYLNGSDVEEEGIATGLIDSMLKVSESDDCNFILETGGCNSWKNDAVEGGTTQRFEIHNGKLEEVEKMPRANMGSTYTLSDFLQWGAANYPAQHYVLMMFTPGNAWRGISYDSSYGDSCITLGGLDNALSQSGVHFDDIVFNSGLMATVEVAATVSPHADYMVASEDSIFSMIYDEGSILDYVVRHAEGFNGELFGKNVVNTLAKNVESVFSDRYKMFSLIDLSKIDNLVAAIDEASDEMLEILKDTKKTTRLLNDIDRAKSFALTTQRDLGDFAHKNYYLSTSVRTDLDDALDDAVVYVNNTKDWARTSGLSIFFPDLSRSDKNGAIKNQYSLICPAKEYLAFLDSLCVGWHLYPDIAERTDKIIELNPTDYAFDYELVSTGDTSFGAVLYSSFDTIYSGRYRILRYDDGNYYSLGEYGNLNIDTDKNIIGVDLDGRYLAIDGATCSLRTIEEGSDYITFATDVLVNGSLQELWLKYTYKGTHDAYYGNNMSYDDGKFSVLGLYNAGDGNSGRVELDLRGLDEGDEITFVIPVYIGGKEYQTLGDTIKYHKNLDVEYKSLPNGSYACEIVLENGILQETKSPKVKYNITNGKVSDMVVPYDASETDKLLLKTSGGQRVELGKLQHCVNPLEIQMNYMEDDEKAEYQPFLDRSSEVYFTSDISAKGLVNAFNALVWKPKGNVAVKISTGESNKSNHLKPELIADLVKKVKGTLVECNTAYEGNRSSSEDHYKLAEEHGYTSIADIDIMDDEGQISLPVNGGELLKENFVGSHFKNYDSFIVLSHFKGHAMAGFGGAIKNSSIGIASAPDGKIQIHSGGRSTTDFMDDVMEKEVDDFQKSMAEATLSVSDALNNGDNIIYINVMNNLSIDCDCDPNPSKPDIHDVGILVSTDPVALDQACVELSSQCDGSGSLMYRISDRHGLVSLEHGEEIGLGSRYYKLINLDK